MKNTLTHLTCSEYDLPYTGRTILLTYSEAKDSFSEWVRSKYRILDNLQLGINILSVSPGSFVDLGANIGTFSIPLLKAVRCRSTLVEALRDNCFLLKAALALNDISDATVLNLAILDKNGMAHMAGESAYGRVSKDEMLPAVTCQTMDSICLEHGLDNTTLLKMDIEGSELRALNGASLFFERNPKVNVIFEANGGHCHPNGYRPADLLRFFEKLHYDLYAIVNQALIRQTSEHFQPFGNIDYLATKLPVCKLPFREAKLSRAQIVQGVLEALTNQNRAYRDYMVSELCYAPTDIQHDPSIRNALSQLPDIEPN